MPFSHSDSSWDASARIVRTKLTGPSAIADVEAWRQGLLEVVASIPAASTFRLLANLLHYEPREIAAHQAMRSVVPLLLSRHGMRPVLLDLFDDDSGLVVTLTRGVRCTACANVHHDKSKMDHYQRRLGTSNQAFFCDIGAAEAWLLAAPEQVE